jgi:hypothetical protein
LIASATKKKRVCKRKKKLGGCETSEFGCCYDKKTPAKGPFSAGKAKKNEHILNYLFKMKIESFN